MLETSGQIAYNAYYKTCYGLSLISGVKLPKWDEQREDIKAAWEAAADAVRVSFRLELQPNIELTQNKTFPIPAGQYKVTNVGGNVGVNGNATPQRTLPEPICLPGTPILIHGSNPPTDKQDK